MRTRLPRKPLHNRSRRWHLRTRAVCVVANPRNSYGYCCGLRLASHPDPQRQLTAQIMQRFPSFFSKALLCLGLLIACVTAQAFELSDLRQQLQQAPVVRGRFVQQKVLRGDTMVTLTSRGDFTLANGKGLLWYLHSPIEQILRITPNGIARRVTEQGSERWRLLSQQNRHETLLFLSVLSGDTKSLQKQFTLVLSGNANDWQLRLIPISTLLRQIFSDIQISGGVQVARIVINETQGDATIVQLHDATPDNKLNATETQAFAD